MTYQANVYRVMLASPSDVKDERNEFPRILEAWNALHSTHEKVVILPVKWETHSVPEVGNRPQAVINKHLVNDSDILVGVFWTRLGTPTGVAASGSVEEIEEFRSQGKPALLYFSSAPVVAESINVEQYQLLKEVRDKCSTEGLVVNYDSVSGFRELLLRHLLETVRRLQGKEQDFTKPSIKSHGKGRASANKAKVGINVEHTVTRSYDELEEYQFRVNLTNIGTTLITNYRLDIEFPKAFLNSSTIYALGSVDVLLPNG